MNHYYDAATDATRCQEHRGITAQHVSANNAVTCPDCWNSLTAAEREGDWYGRVGA